MKKGLNRKIWIPALLFCLLLGMGAEYIRAAPAGKDLEEMAVHFLDVGQGDCTLVTCGSDAMLIDAGDNDQGTRIQNYLQKQGIGELDYVVATHPDADHIGGLDVILYKFDCGTIFMTDEKKDTGTYRDVISTMKNRGYKSTLPEVGQQYALGDATFTIVGPSPAGGSGNDSSIAILLTHGSKKFLFTGDAEEKEEQDILGSGISIDADVYKAGHHGSRSSSSEELLEAVTPAYAVISCGEGNSYGHPHAQTLNNLRAMGVQVYRTDEQGTIIARSDGKEISWNCAPSDSWIAGEPTGTRTTEAAQGQTSAAVTYICNTNTGKFHYPDCSSVKQMSEKNRLEVTKSRDQVIADGYEACKKCKP